MYPRNAHLVLGAARHPAHERLGGRAVDVDPIRGGTLSHLAVDEIAHIELSGWWDVCMYMHRYMGKAGERQAEGREQEEAMQE